MQNKGNKYFMSAKKGVSDRLKKNIFSNLLQQREIVGNNGNTFFLCFHISCSSHQTKPIAKEIASRGCKPSILEM